MKISLNKVLSVIDPLDFDHESWRGVSIILINEDEIFLIKRSHLMPTHAGQMGGIGGLRKSYEQNIAEVAKREFTEETSMSDEMIQILGALPSVMTARNQSIIPVIAWLNTTREDFFNQVKSNGEWTDIISVPWSDLFNINHWSWGRRIGLTEIQILLFPLTPSRYKHYQNKNDETYILWGATARMIWSFIERYPED